jgi:hypothetical protein
MVTMSWLHGQEKSWLLEGGAGGSSAGEGGGEGGGPFAEVADDWLGEGCGDERTGLEGNCVLDGVPVTGIAESPGEADVSVTVDRQGGPDGRADVALDEVAVGGPAEDELQCGNVSLIGTSGTDDHAGGRG